MNRNLPRRPGVIGALLGVLLIAAGCGEDPGPTETDSSLSVQAAAAATAIAWLQVSTSDNHTCAITAAGRAYCWGDNEDGQLGDGTRDTRTRPTPVSGNLVFRNVSAGAEHSCGVTTDFLAYCWGSPDNGRLGTGSSTTAHLTPARVAGSLRFRTVAAATSHTCALTQSTERAYCWGDNRLGQLGDGTHTQRNTPVPVAGNRRFMQVTASVLHTCALKPTGAALCWGFNLSGQLGDGTNANRNRPTLVAGGHLFTQISAGFATSCGVTAKFQAFCWGGPVVGDGTTEQRLTPRLVAGKISFRRVTAGDAHICGEAVGSKAYCWGTGSLGSLGNGVGGTVIVTKPVPVSGGLFFAQLSAGRGTCGTIQSSALYCWGENSFGQLGDGTTESRFVPTQVAEPQ